MSNTTDGPYDDRYDRWCEDQQRDQYETAMKEQAEREAMSEPKLYPHNKSALELLDQWERPIKAATVHDDSFVVYNRVVEDVRDQQATITQQKARIEELESEVTRLRTALMQIRTLVSHRQHGHQWRCFHCEEVFTEQEAAAEHFGREQCCTPRCCDPSSDNERQLSEQVGSLRNERDNLQDKLDGLEAHFDELMRYFGQDCTSVWQAGDRYSNAKFEVKTQAETITQQKARIEELETGRESWFATLQRFAALAGRGG